MISEKDIKNAEECLAWMTANSVTLQGLIDGTLVAVPTAPTDEMVNYGYQAMRTENVIDSSEQGRVKRIYKAMLERRP